MKIVVAITGASGVRYGVRLLEVLSSNKNIELHLIVTETAKKILKFEENLSLDSLKKLVSKCYSEDEIDASIASGSSNVNAMIIIPCSMKTLACIANGIASNLVTRVADVILKERRPLILVTRETPLSLIHLENMLKVTKAGAVVMPACPAFYIKPKDVDDFVNFIVGRVLDILNIDHNLYRRYGKSRE